VKPPPLDRAALLHLLRDLQSTREPESAHAVADRALLAYINDPDITEAYGAVPKWYA
jgi:hypothetical protein